MSGKDNLSTWDLEVIGKLIQRDKEIAALKQQVIDARRAAIEECAKVADAYGDARADARYENAFEIAEAIRALAGPTE